MGLGVCAMSSAPSGRAPVPQSNMKQAPPLVVTPTHEVLPPKRTVPGPGAAIDPRVPQNRTRIPLQCQLFILHVETVEVPGELRGPRANLLGLTASGRLLQGCADLCNPVQAVAGAGSLRVWAQDANVFVNRVFEPCSYRLDVPPSVLQEAGNQLHETRVHPDADASHGVLFDGVQERRFADGFGEVARAASIEAVLDLLRQRVSGQCQDRHRPGTVLTFPLADPA